jgi:hypothetical protein
LRKGKYVKQERRAAILLAEVDIVNFCLNRYTLTRYFFSPLNSFPLILLFVSPIIVNPLYFEKISKWNKFFKRNIPAEPYFLYSVRFGRMPVFRIHETFWSRSTDLFKNYGSIMKLRIRIRPLLSGYNGDSIFIKCYTQHLNGAKSKNY